MRKSAYSALFLILLFSSCSPYRHQWKLAAIKASCPDASYVKIYLPACNTFNGLEAEFMCSNGDMQLNLNIHTLQFPMDSDDGSHATVNVIINEDIFPYTANRLLGGQRIVMPQEACQQIIGALLEGNNVDITVGRYETTLLSEGFAKHYDELVAKSYP